MKNKTVYKVFPKKNGVAYSFTYLNKFGNTVTAYVTDQGLTIPDEPTDSFKQKIAQYVQLGFIEIKEVVETEESIQNEAKLIEMFDKLVKSKTEKKIAEQKKSQVKSTQPKKETQQQQKKQVKSIKEELNKEENSESSEQKISLLKK